MRLIDADKITRVLTELQEYSFDGKINIESVLYLISIQNTAYDIDKVVEELQDKAFRVNDDDIETSIYETGMMGKAIEIVKAGGKNDN